MDNYKVIGVDITNLPDQSVEIPIGCEPKVKCKNKLLQKILIKIFGYKVVYKTVLAKVLTTNAEDCPKDWGSTLTFSIED